jgi:hypothetical protein
MVVPATTATGKGPRNKAAALDGARTVTFSPGIFALQAEQPYAGH